MARFYNPTPEQVVAWAEWLAARPENVRRVAERFDPWSLYRLKSSGHRVHVLSFGEHEDGSVTLTVVVSGDFNFVAFPRRVFGIPPDDLELCELPLPGEKLGAALTDPDEITAFLEAKAAEQVQRN